MGSLIGYRILSGFRGALARDRSSGGLVGRRLDEFLDLDTPVRVKDDGQTGCIFFIFLASVDRKHAGDLSKDADPMNRIEIFHRVAVAVPILEQECPNIRLTALDHILNCSNYNWVTHNKSFVETGKKWSSRNGECENLGVYFRDG